MARATNTTGPGDLVDRHSVKQPFSEHFHFIQGSIMGAERRDAGTKGVCTELTHWGKRHSCTTLDF